MGRHDDHVALPQEMRGARDGNLGAALRHIDKGVEGGGVLAETLSPSKAKMVMVPVSLPIISLLTMASF